MSSPKPDIDYVADPDGAAILDAKRGALARLNSTGSYVWQRLERGDPIEQIVRDLASDTGADTATVERDVQVFTEQLRAHHLLRGKD